MGKLTSSSPTQLAAGRPLYHDRHLIRVKSVDDGNLSTLSICPPKGLVASPLKPVGSLFQKLGRRISLGQVATGHISALTGEGLLLVDGLKRNALHICSR